MIPTFTFLAAGGFNPMTFDPAAAGLTVITTLILVFLMGKFAWGPMMKAIDEREERIEGAIAKAEKDRAEAEALLKQYQETVKNVEQEVAALRDKGKTDAEALRADILARAEADAKARGERALNEIELARTQALEDIRREAVGIGMAVASKVIGRSLDEGDHARLAAEVVDGIGGVTSGGS